MFKSFLAIITVCLAFISCRAANNKILFVVDTLPKSAQAGLMHQLLAAQKAGFDSALYVTKSLSYSPTDLETMYHDVINTFYYKTIPEDIPLYKLIVCQSAAAAGSLITAQKKLNLTIPVVTYIQRTDLSTNVFKYAGKGRTFFSDITVCLCDSLYTKHQLELRGCQESKIMVLPMPVDTKQFKFRFNVLDPYDTIRFISVGPLHECRPYQDMIKILKDRFVKANPEVKLRYTIIGSGPCEENIAQAIVGYGMENYVDLVGWCDRDTIIKLLYQSHIFLLPLYTTHDGLQEGIPDCLKEAMAVGTVVVTMRHGGVPELIENNATGIITSERDLSHFGNSLISLIKHPEVWPSMQLNARGLIEKKYSISTFQKNFMTLLHSL